MNDYITHSSFLEEIGRNIREKAEHNQKSISDFNIMRFVRKNEMGLSAILAFFLDPNESHKQGDFFLKGLLKEIAREDFLDYESVSVETEKITINRRRHDIFIEGRKNNKGIWGICIENKLLGAGDAENQLSDYIKDLRTLYNENFFVIYLTRNKRPPSPFSILEKDWDELDKANKAKIFDPEDIIRILSEKTLEKDNIDFFHHDFIAFLRTLMFQEKIPPSWVKNITNNQNLVKTSIQLIENQEFIYHSLIEILIKQLNDKCEIFDLLVKNGFEIQKYGEISSRYFSIGFYPKENYKVGVSFEFGKKYFRDCYYGIWHDRSYKTNQEEKFKKINSIIIDRLGKNKKSSSSWFFYDYFDGNLLNWNSEVWSDLLHSGKLAEIIFAKWEPLIKILQDNYEDL